MKAAALALLATLALPAGSQQDQAADWYTGQHKDLFLAEPEEDVTGIDWQVRQAFETWSTSVPQAYGKRGVWVSDWMRERNEVDK